MLPSPHTPRLYSRKDTLRGSIEPLSVSFREKAILSKEVAIANYHHQGLGKCHIQAV